MTAQITSSTRQWASRPRDAEFATLDRLVQVTEDRRNASTTMKVDASDLTVVAHGDDVRLQGPNGGTASFTNYSFGQLASLAGAPAKYLAKLPGKIIADALNFGLATADKALQVLTLRGSQGRVLRAVNGEGYSRLWDAQFAGAVRDLIPDGSSWAPPAEFARGQRNAPEGERVNRGLYLGDRRSEIVLVDQVNGITVPGAPTLYRGLRFWGSEVGQASQGCEAFLWAYVCGNRLFFSVTPLLKRRRNHVGDIHSRMIEDIEAAFGAIDSLEFASEIRAITQATQLVVAESITEAQNYLVAAGFSKPEAERAVRLAELEEGGAATLWQLTQGVTASARAARNNDTRSDLESRAGRLVAAARPRLVTVEGAGTEAPTITTAVTVVE